MANIFGRKIYLDLYIIQYIWTPKILRVYSDSDLLSRKIIKSFEAFYTKPIFHLVGLCFSSYKSFILALQR